MASGDVEDAPALDPVSKFPIVEKDGSVYVKGDGEKLQGARRHPGTKCSAKGQDKVLIVGGYVGSWSSLRLTC